MEIGSHYYTKLPRTTWKHDSIMVVVEKFTEATHFSPIKMTHTVTNTTKIHMNIIARIHGVPKVIV